MAAINGHENTGSISRRSVSRRGGSRRESVDRLLPGRTADATFSVSTWECMSRARATHDAMRSGTQSAVS
jgi:hypothetical protein